jgi:hypothetical protein
MAIASSAAGSPAVAFTYDVPAFVSALIVVRAMPLASVVLVCSARLPPVADHVTAAPASGAPEAPKNCTANVSLASQSAITCWVSPLSSCERGEPRAGDSGAAGDACRLGFRHFAG